MRNGFFLAKAEYYAPFPIFKLDSDLLMGDINLATQVLLYSVLHEDLRRSIKCAFGDLQLGALENGVVADGASSSTAGRWDAAVQAAAAHLDSTEFGAIDLNLTVFSLPDPGSVNLLDRTVYAEIKSIEHEHTYRTKLQAALQHQLIWETYAISYDVILPELDFYRDVVSRHTSALSAAGVDHVIDIGAGTGNVTIPLLDSGRFVTAVDISRAMLDRMRTKLSARHKAKIAVTQQDARDLSGIADRSFDGVNILLALFDMSDPSAALREAVRVLRPRGILVITEPKRSFNLPALLSHAERDLQAKGMYTTLSSHWLRVSKVNKKIDPAMRSTPLFTEDIQERLGKAGFTIARMEDSHHGHCATLWAVKAA